MFVCFIKKNKKAIDESFTNQSDLHFIKWLPDLPFFCKLNV